MQRSSSIPRQDQKERRTHKRYQVQRQEDDELHNLPYRERAIHSANPWPPQHLHRIRLLSIQISLPLHQLITPFFDKHSVEDIHQRFVHEKSFEQQGRDGSPFSEHQERAVDPGEGEGVEDGEEEDLRDVGPEEEGEKDEQG